MEAHGTHINDHSWLLPEVKQRILMDGYQLPLDFKNGLPYLWCQTPTEEELASLPHIVMTSNADWDPSHYDKDINDLADIQDPSEDNHENYLCDQYGEYCHRTVATHSTCPEKKFMTHVSFLTWKSSWWIDGCSTPRIGQWYLWFSFY
jgi:hypothetical protein